MKLQKIAINNLRRRKARAMFLVIGLMIGIGSIVSMFSTTQILEEDIVHKMEEFGANIVIVPMAQELSINYAGLNVGGIAFDIKEISQIDIEKIKTIKNASNIRSTLAGSIPEPVSDISIINEPALMSLLTVIVISPFFVNFTELLRRLIRICFSRRGSVLIYSGKEPTNFVDSSTFSSFFPKLIIEFASYINLDCSQTGITMQLTDSSRFCLFKYTIN